MEDNTHRSIYRLIKWIWLLSQCAMPILAAMYLARFFINKNKRRGLAAVAAACTAGIYGALHSPP